MDNDIASLANSYSSLGEQHRYLGADPDRTKRLPRSYHYVVKGGSRTDFGRRTLIHRDLPDYKLGLLEQVVRHPDQSRSRVDRRRQLHRLRGRWGSDAQEGRDLALSDVPLPSDFTQQPRRCPSLERQEAFRYESTAKRRAGSSQSSSSEDGGDAAAVAELYRLGLLYDDEHLRGSGFDFRSLERQEPAYSLRPAKRARKLNRARGYDEPEARYDNHPAGNFGMEQKLPLPLELSFAEIGRDDAIARFLISPSPSETSEDEGGDEGDLEVDRARRMQEFYDARALQRRLDELRGLAKSVPTLFEEMVQEEEEEEEEGGDVSDLVYDKNTQDTDLNSNDAYDTDGTEKGEKQEQEEDQESDEDTEWTVLARNDAGEVADADEAERDAASGSGGGAAGAWVVLGDDS